MLGAQNLVVVSTADAVLVLPRDRAQDVRAIVERLKAAQATLADASELKRAGIDTPPMPVALDLQLVRARDGVVQRAGAEILPGPARDRAAIVPAPVLIPAAEIRGLSDSRFAEAV